MNVLSSAQSLLRKIEFEESKNIIIPGSGEQGVALEMLIGATAAVIGAAGIGGTVAIGSLALSPILIAGIVVGSTGAVKAYKMTTQRYWEIVFDKLDLKTRKETPILKNNILHDDGREFSFEVPVGMSIKDFQDKKEAIEMAFRRRIDISLDESTYQVTIFLYK